MLQYIPIQHEKTLLKYFSSDSYRGLLKRWKEPHRYFHTLEHLCGILNQFHPTDDLMVLTAFGHDLVYDPRKTGGFNEKQSAEVFIHSVKQPELGIVGEAAEIILSTADFTHKKDFNQERFFMADCLGLYRSDAVELLKYENQIFKEFQFWNYSKYKEGRVDFLNKAIREFPLNSSNLISIRNWVNDRKPKIGLYVGSFDPWHVGHENILKQAEKIFDKVVIGVGVNSNKNPRVSSTVVPSLQYHEFFHYSNLTTDLVKELSKVYDVTLIRGLRNGHDLNEEENLRQFYREMDPTVKVVYFLCDVEFKHISSSALRGIRHLSKSYYEKYIP